MALPIGEPESDEALVARIASGDRSAFEALYDRWQRRLFHYVLRVIGDPPGADALVNDVMVEVWKGARRFGGRGKASTWILAIAHHRALNEVRARRRRAWDAEPVSEELPDPAEGPDARAEEKDLGAGIRRALGALSPAHREVIELTFYEGLSYDETAAIAGCPPGTVKTRMFHAKRRLRAVLEGMGLAGELP